MKYKKSRIQQVYEGYVEVQTLSARMKTYRLRQLRLYYNEMDKTREKMYTVKKSRNIKYPKNPKL